jgi:hypothetical protein
MNAHFFVNQGKAVFGPPFFVEFSAKPALPKRLTNSQPKWTPRFLGTKDMPKN